MCLLRLGCQRREGWLRGVKGLQSYRYREDFPLQSLQSGASKCCHSVYGLARGHLILKTFFEFEFLQKGNSKRILKTSTEFTLISLCAHVFNAFYTFFGFGKLISAWHGPRFRFGARSTWGRSCGSEAQTKYSWEWEHRNNDICLICRSIGPSKADFALLLTLHISSLLFDYSF